MSYKDNYSFTEMEAALCFWEAFLEKYDDSDYRANVGTMQVRFEMIEIAEPFLKLYDSCRSEIEGDFSYDWEIVPAFLNAAMNLVIADENLSLPQAFNEHGSTILNDALISLGVRKPELCDCGKSREECARTEC